MGILDGTSGNDSSKKEKNQSVVDNSTDNINSSYDNNTDTNASAIDKMDSVSDTIADGVMHNRSLNR